MLNNARRDLDELVDAELVTKQAAVLIVDDESLNRFLITEALAADNYRIIEAESGEAAVEYIRNHHADLILLDIDMPGMGGLAACETIRALPHGELIPIAMVTGLDDNTSIERAFDCGATDFLTKPVNWTLMRQRVRFMLRHGNITNELQQNEKRYAAIFEASPVGLLEADGSRLLEITEKPGFADSTDEQLKNEVALLLVNGDRKIFSIKANPTARQAFMQKVKDSKLGKLRAALILSFLVAIRDKRNELVLRYQLPLKTGESRDIVINAHLPKTRDAYQRIVISLSDVTDLLWHEAQLKRADAIIANSSDAVAVMDKNRQVHAINPAYTRVTGYTLEQMRTIDILTQLPISYRDRTVPEIRETLNQQDYWRGEVEFQRCDGSLMPAIVQINVIRNERGEFDGCVTITTDISHIKESEKRFYQLAHFDALTGLPNRLSLQERLQAEFNNATHDNHATYGNDAAHRNGFCLLYIDLDGFKLVNDSMGHPTGDALLREVSVRLGKSCDSGDLLTRIGGDEFALLMLKDATTAAIDAQAKRIFSALESSFAMKEREIFIGASIGACRYPEDASNAEEMLRNADSAMYEAKRLGRGQLCYYSTELTTVSDHRLQVENELRVAISSDQLFLVYQPKYDAASGIMVGAEALVRWRNPKRGVVPPLEFIGIAEASGLIVPLGEWVINEACRQLAEWQRNHGRVLPVAINISALHLREKSLLQVLGAAIARFDIDPKLLEIEITEDSLDFRGDEDKPYAMLNALSQIGLSIAIDDFGTGYSSLSQLKNMPISTLKIDSSFVRDIAASGSDHAIITAIVGLAKTLDMNVVAEGVETEEQARHLRTLKCNVLQGYLYSKPLPPEEFLEKYIAQRDAL